MEHKMLPCTHFPPTALNFGIAKPSKRAANICRQAIGSGECYWTQKVNLEELNTSPNPETCENSKSHSYACDPARDLETQLKR